MAGQRDDFSLPMLSTTPDYQSIVGMLSSISNLPRLRASIQPELEGLMGQGGPILAPALADLGRSTQANVAAAQSDAMRRGLTGSDIEMASMRGERESGLRAESGLRGQFAQSLVDLLFKAQAGDIDAATQLRTMLSQAMGEEMTAQRDMQMFQQQLQELGAQGAANRKSQLISSGIGAIGQIGSSFARYSDSRLKRSLKRIGEASGIGLWSWTWNKRSSKVGMVPGEKSVGVLADEVRNVYPEAIGHDKGFLTVDIGALPEPVMLGVVGLVVAGGA